MTTVKKNKIDVLGLSYSQNAQFFWAQMHEFF